MCGCLHWKNPVSLRGISVDDDGVEDDEDSSFLRRFFRPFFTFVESCRFDKKGNCEGGNLKVRIVTLKYFVEDKYIKP